MHEGNKMSNGPPPACPDDAINARWLFPQEQASSPPRDKGCKHNGLGDLALLSSNGSQPTPSPPFSFNVNTKTTLDELCELVAATVTATTKKIDAYTKANQELFTANVMTTSHPIAINVTAISHPIAANAAAITTMAELQELVAATVAATAKEIDAYAKAN